MYLMASVGGSPLPPPRPQGAYEDFRESMSRGDKFREVANFQPVTTAGSKASD